MLVGQPKDILNSKMTDKRFIPNLLQEASSGCLLPFLLLTYALVAILGVIGSILILGGYIDPPEGLLSPIKEVYAVSLVLSFLYLLSIIGIMQEKESSVAGFILITVILFVISVFAGGSAYAEINTFVLAIILLLLLRLDEWKELDPEQLKGYYLEARKTEISDPKIALKQYRQLERLNRDVNPFLVLIGALSMPLAYLLGQWLNSQLSLTLTWVESITLALVGVGPIIWVFEWWRFRAIKRSEKYESKIEEAANGCIPSKIWVLLLPILALFADWLELLLCMIIAALSAVAITGAILLPYKIVSIFYSAPTMDAYTLFENIVPILSFELLILLVIVSAAEPRLKPVSRILPELPVALKTNLENFLSFLTAIVTLFVFANLYLKSPFFVRLDTRGELIQHAMSGALLGYIFSVRVRFQVFNVLVKLGQARCLRRIGRQLEGFYVVYRLADRMDSRYIPTAYFCLVESVLLQLDPLRTFCEHCVKELISKVRRNSNDTLLYPELFNDVMERGL